jgi:hypothetical protein
MMVSMNQILCEWLLHLSWVFMDNHLLHKSLTDVWMFGSLKLQDHWDVGTWLCCLKSFSWVQHRTQNVHIVPVIHFLNMPSSTCSNRQISARLPIHTTVLPPYLYPSALYIAQINTSVSELFVCVCNSVKIST